MNEGVEEDGNGNFLGALEMLSRHNEVLKSHLEEVGKSQQEGTRMKAHYLSPSSQNEFINECGQLVMDAVMEEA